MERSELFYATTNPGKVSEVTRFAEGYGYRVVTPADAGLSLEVDETGETLEANAELKARAWRDELSYPIVLADDTGFEIDALDGEPGVHVRRWRDGETAMTDDEIVAYCMERMTGIPAKERGAQTHTVIALARPEGEVEFFHGTLRGIVLEEPDEDYRRVEGFPLERIFYVPEWQMMLAETRNIPVADRGEYITHREKAVKKALAAIANR